MTHAAHGHALDRASDVECRLSPAANWLWFAPDIGHSSALVIGEVTPSYLRGLSTRFERVETIPVSSLHRAVASADPKAPGSVRLVFGEGSMDYVISTDLLHGWEPGRSPYRDPRFVAALAELRRVLRPGGVLFLSGQNTRWHKAWLRKRPGEAGHIGPSGGAGASLRVSPARRVLERAGF